MLNDKTLLKESSQGYGVILAIRHTGWHKWTPRVTRHEWTRPPKSNQTGWCSVYLPGRDGRPCWPRFFWCTPRCFTSQQTVIHPSSIRAWCRATSLIEPTSFYHYTTPPP